MSMCSRKSVACRVYFCSRNLISEGFGFGRIDELLLQSNDVAGEVGRIRDGLEACQRFGFLGREVAGLDYPLIRGFRIVVGPGISSRLHRPPPVGFLRRQEHVLAQIHEAPQLVEQYELGRGVVAVSKRAFADDVAVGLPRVWLTSDL